MKDTWIMLEEVINARTLVIFCNNYTFQEREAVYTFGIRHLAYSSILSGWLVWLPESVTGKSILGLVNVLSDAQLVTDIWKAYTTRLNTSVKQHKHRVWILHECLGSKQEIESSGSMSQSNRSIIQAGLKHVMSDMETRYSNTVAVAQRNSSCLAL